jgi:hypothetical protein
MEAILKLLPLLGFNLAYIVAGFSGGIVTLIFVQTSRNRAVTGTLGGALTANYLAQPVLKFLSLPPTAELGGAFICGIVAIKIVNGIYNRGIKFEKGQPLTDEDAETKGVQP